MQTGSYSQSWLIYERAGCRQVSSIVINELYCGEFKILTRILFIQDDLWKESLNVLKLAVSSCSQLEIPVQRAPSVMFDSTWSLDMSVAARQELPGKTLDFTFDLSTSLVSPQESQDVPQKNLNETSGWKRPQLSQVMSDIFFLVQSFFETLHYCDEWR